MNLSRLALLPMMMAASAAMADWTLAPESRLTFQSTKNIHKTETHHFSSVSGVVKNNGSATVKIDLTSVKTGIQIRDQRMQEHLFETGKFATATLQSSVPRSIMKRLATGKTQSFDLSGSIALHGKRIAFKTPVMATPAKDGSLVVSSLAPLMLDARKFALDGGVDTLKNIAKLNNIGYNVPVNFTLVFKPE